MNTYKIAAIPGDGIGKEVIAAGIEVLQAVAEKDGGFKVDISNFDWGSDRYKATGQSDASKRCRCLKAISFNFFWRSGRTRCTRSSDPLGSETGNLSTA